MRRSNLELIHECEGALAGFFGKRYCIWTGNGTSALALCYSLTAVDKPKILVPALMCMHPMIAVTYAVKTPVFCDVLEDNGTIDPDLVDNLLSQDRDIGAVLAVHLFGNAAEMTRLLTICAKHSVLLIEDLAQAFGGRFPDGSLFGTRGDLSVVSFGYSKILDTGDGGAVLTDDKSAADALRCAQDKLPPRAGNVAELALGYKNLYYQIVSLGSSIPQSFELFDLFPELFRQLFLYRSTGEAAQVLTKRLAELDLEIHHRRTIADIYTNELAGIPGLQLFRGFSGIPWRFSFRLNPSVRQDLLRRIRLEGFDASSWYPCLTDWCASGRSQGSDLFPVANQLGREVVNLWVDRTYNVRRAENLARFIKKALS